MMKSLRNSLCFLLFSVVILGVSERSNYTFGLIRYLKEKSKLYQVMFIIDDQFLANAETNADTQLLRDVSKHFPSLSMSLHQAQNDLEKYFSLRLKIPRRTTLFVFILHRSKQVNLRQVTTALDKLRDLSYGHSYPKCLINFSNQRKAYSYENMLKTLWHKDMLDISVLDTLFENQTWQAKNVITIHRVNLFADKYTHQKVKPRTKWFPNKLLDLHGKSIKLMLLTTSGVISKNKYIEILKFRDYIMQSMHCRIIHVINKSPTPDLKLLSRAGVEMAINFIMIGLPNSTTISQSLRIISFSTAKAVIEDVTSKTRSAEVSQEFIYMVAATTVAIAVIKITTMLLQFSRRTWNTFNISQIIIGMSVVNEPRKLAERIVFGSFMLSCMVYSGYLFSVILDINFRNAPQITTLEELANSSLTPMLNSFTNDSISGSPLAHIRKLASKSVRVPGSGFNSECLEYLLKNRNVSCILIDAERALKVFKNVTQEVSFKVLEESIVYFPKSWVSRDGSPYIDRFNEIILNAFDHGFLQKLFFGDSMPKINKVSSPEIIDKEKLLLVLFYVLTIGFTLATIVFLVEILNNFIWRKTKQVWRNYFNFF